MAKHNLVYLYGAVVAPPRIITDENGVLRRGHFVLQIIRGLRSIGDGNRVRQIRYDCPVVMSDNVEKIEIMNNLVQGDMVEIKGFIYTKEIRKTTKCPDCEHKNVTEGNVVTVHPIYLHKREHAESEEEVVELLKENFEISNQATVIGTLCRDPEGFRSDKGGYITQYQLAVNRKFHVKEDPAEIKADYPWIKSFGQVAENDMRALSMRSVVFVDGCIQTREVQRNSTCEKCGHNYSWKDSALEIVPYSVEYLQNFKSMETSMEEDRQKAKDEFNKFIGIKTEEDIDKYRNDEIERRERRVRAESAKNSGEEGARTEEKQGKTVPPSKGAEIDNKKRSKTASINSERVEALKKQLEEG